MKKATRILLTFFLLFSCSVLFCMTASAASKPAVPKNLRHSSSKTKSITVKWNTAKNAEGYEIYMSKEDGKFKLVGKTKKDSFAKGSLKVGKKYTFMVRSYRKVNGKTAYSAYSNKVTITATKMTKAANSVHSAYYNATLKSNVKVKLLSTGKKKAIKKGTKVVATGFDGSPVCYLASDTKQKNGFKISSKKLNYQSLKVTTSDTYSKKTKEAYVNGRQYGSPTDYLIWVSQYTLRVNVFKGARGNWKLVKSMPCVIGKLSTRTPVGIYSVQPTSHAHGPYGGPIIYYTTYSSKYNSANAFHDFINGQTRGAASNGCIRLARADLMWLYNNCKVGTTVITF